MSGDAFPNFPVPKCLDPAVRRDLERRGVDSVRDLLRSTRGTTPDSPVPVPLLDGGIQILRGHVEMWLIEIDAAAKAKEESRARWTFAVAVVAAVASIIAAWPVVQEWLRPVVTGVVACIVAVWPVVKGWFR